MKSLNILQYYYTDTIAHNVHSIGHYMYNAFNLLDAPGNGTPIGGLLTGYRM